MSEHYLDFDLHIALNGHAIANSPEGQATADIPTQVPNSIRLSLNLIEKRAADADLLKQVGQALYDWLFPSNIHTHFHQTEARARLEKAKIRLRLRIEAESIASLPLEFLYRMQGGYFLAVNPGTVLSRYVNLPLPPERVRRREGPLHMLAIIADPTDQTRLPPGEWEAIIRDALAVPLANREMTLQTVKRATRKEIRNALLQQKPDIIQFVGHGIYQNGQGYLALVDDQTSKTWLVNDETFANLYLGSDDHLGLISLATCESAKSDNPQGFLGIAPKLVQRGVPAVLSMQYKVLIKTAKIFMEDFYTIVAARKPIDWAIQSARNAVSQELGLDNREFATPVLYMRAQDGNVFW
jgi:CHAT domain-containing protein